MDKISHIFILVLFLDLTSKISTATAKHKTFNLFQANVLDHVDTPVIAHSKLLIKDVVFNDHDIDNTSSLEDISEEQDYIPQKYKSFYNADANNHKNKMTKDGNLINETHMNKDPQDRKYKMFKLREFLVQWLKDKSNDTNINSEEGAKKYALRKRWNIGAFRKAAKACICAGRKALKAMCKEFKCTRDEKKSFKKDSKSICYEMFEYDPSEDDDDDDDNDSDDDSC